MLRIRSFPFALVFILLLLSGTARGQQWSGILAPNRAVDWSHAGATIQNRSTICQTLGTAGQSSSYSQNVTAAQIQSALQSCAGSNQVVYLNPGTYTMTQTVTTSASNVTLRGAGANQTILNYTGTNYACNGINNVAFCVTNGDSGNQYYAHNVCTITSGASQGSTSVVLGSAATGGNGYSCGTPQVGTLIQFTLPDDSSDPGSWWKCGTSGSNGSCSQQGTANAWTGRTTGQMVTVTGVSGSTVNFTPALYAPVWNNTAYAGFSSTLPVTGFGLENLQINTQNIGDIQAMLETNWVTQSWAKNVALINAEASRGAARKHVEISNSVHVTVRDSYLYGSSPSSEAYGVDNIYYSSDNLAENNICQHLATCNILETGIGNVYAYTYDVDNFYTGGGSAPNWQQCDAYHHDAGDHYNLFEGQEGICAAADNIHGTSFANTIFRSYFNGRDPASQCPGGGTGCGTGSKTQNTIALTGGSGNRYWNYVDNVVGTPGYHNTYENLAPSGSGCGSVSSTVEYVFGWSFNQTAYSSSCSGWGFTINNDVLAEPGTSSNGGTGTSVMLLGNYDVVSGAVQTNSYENGSSAPSYPALSNPSTTWSSYPSLYLSSKPGFWGSMPWPAVGPDVTGGNIAGVNGHAYHNPAANCYLNVLGGKTDGSSGPLNFDANACYPTAGSTAAGPPAPTNLTGTVLQ